MEDNAHGRTDRDQATWTQDIQDTTGKLDKSCDKLLLKALTWPMPASAVLPKLFSVSDIR